MAYASAVALTVQEITRTGIPADKNLVTPTATHGNKIPNDGRVFLHLVNGSAAPVTVTIDVDRQVDGLELPDLTITLAATGDSGGLDIKDVGPFPATFNQSDGYVWAVFSAVTTCKIGAFRLSAV